MIILDAMEYASDALAQAAWNGLSAAIGGETSGTSASYTGNIYYSKTTASQSGNITKFRVFSNATGKIRVALYTDNAGAANTLIAESTEQDVVAGWNNITFPSTAITASTVYHIGVQSNANNGFCTGSLAGNGYQARAYGAFPATASWSSNPWAVNITGYIPLIEVYTESTIKQQGSYSLKIVAPQTTSLNKTVTKTCSPTWNLSGQTDFKFWARASRTGSNFKIGLHDSGGTTTEVTPNIASADTFQEVTLDISGVSDANKDAIDSIIYTQVNADAETTVYLDWMRTLSEDEGTGGGGMPILGGSIVR